MRNGKSGSRKAGLVSSVFFAVKSGDDRSRKRKQGQQGVDSSAGSQLRETAFDFSKLGLDRGNRLEQADHLIHGRVEAGFGVAHDRAVAHQHEIPLIDSRCIRGLLRSVFLLKRFLHPFQLRHHCSATSPLLGQPGFKFFPATFVFPPNPVQVVDRHESRLLSLAGVGPASGWKRITLILAIALAALLSHVVSAQTLTETQEARVAIAQCYSDCVDRAHESGTAYSDTVTAIFDYAVSAGFRFLSRSDQLLIVDAAKLKLCASAHSHIRQMDACRVGCIDIEQAYGGKTSTHARSRFNRIYIATRDQMRKLGMWEDWNTPFNVAEACERYWNSAGDAKAQADAGDGLEDSFLPMPPALRRLPEWEW